MNWRIIVSFPLLFLFYINKNNYSSDLNYKQNPNIHIKNIANLCDGSVGENMFEDGDFGSGNTTNLVNDPNNYAPGYTYQPAPPPNDGFYTITNNTTDWGWFAQTGWIDIGDNSNDPNGYMMVVNASFDPGIFYQKTINDLCENSTYQFSADVINLLFSTTDIQPNVDFLINNQVLYNTGNIFADQEWHTFGFTFSTQPGETSLVLSLRNNAPGGQGNDLALDNISFQACGPQVNISPEVAQLFCDGSEQTLTAEIIGNQFPTPFFQWQVSTNGITWTDIPGANSPILDLGFPFNGYQYRMTVASSQSNLGNFKCRVISNIHTIEIEPGEVIHFDTICEGAEIMIGDFVYSQPGVYQDTLTGTHLCDSIISVNLATIPSYGLSAELESVPPSCPGVPDGSILVDTVFNGRGNLSYSINGTDFQSDPLFNNLTNGIYEITIRDSYLCQTIESITLQGSSPLFLSLGEDQTTNLGCEVMLQAFSNQPVAQYEWLPSEILSCSDCPNPSWKATDSQMFFLTIWDETGCSTQDSVYFHVNKKRDIYIPNVFTPDGDGQNDLLGVFGGKEIDKILQFKIFTRWGEQIYALNNFYPNDLSQGWNGKFRGREMTSGIYLYMCQVQFVDGVTDWTYGDVFLKR